MKLRELAKELKPLVVEQSQLFILIWRQDRQWEYKTLWDHDLLIEWTPEAIEDMAQKNAEVAEVRKVDPYATIMGIADFYSPIIDNIQSRIMQHYEARRLEVEGQA